MEFVRPMNSVFMYCLQKTGQQLHLKKKKKKKERENAHAARLSAIQTYTKTSLLARLGVRHFPFEPLLLAK